ncbi:CDP-Glycerol:Poly(glycerophosphate) glycerophosphotransferase, partial [Micrococcales bacterium KH10]
IVRDATAIKEYAAVTDWPIVLCPRTADLEIVTASSVRAVFYLNQVARNTDMVAWRGPRHIYLGHGDSNKMLSSHPAHAMYDEIWVAGRHSIDRYRDAGVVIEPSKFVIIGRPQLAVLGDSTGSVAGRNLKAGPSASRPIALYAPTWHGYNSMTQLSSLARGPQIVDELTVAGFDVIFRPHPMSALTRAGRAQIAAIRSRLQTTTPQPKTFAEAAAEADLLVADPSSVIVDFLATGRPVIAILPSKSASSGPMGVNDSADSAVLGLDARVLPALYQVDSSLQNLSEVIADAAGADSLRLTRLKVRDELFADAPEVGWTKHWDEQLTRVLA